jgi:DNA repair protein RecO (recombination protein O)
MRHALTVGSASWVNSPEAEAPFALLRSYVEGKLGRRLKSGALLPPE